MTDDIDLASQWTDQARAVYQQRYEDAVAAMREHVEHTLSRQGRQTEMPQYFDSTERFHKALAQLDEAEFDWCGSFPLGLDSSRYDDDEDDEHDGEEDADAAELDAPVLTVVGRWDYRLVDADALIAAGRDAYLRAWEEDTDEDAAYRVGDAGSAVYEIAHTEGWASLPQAPGLEQLASSQQVIIHEDDGTTWLDHDGDPFAIARTANSSDDQ